MVIAEWAKPMLEAIEIVVPTNGQHGLGGMGSPEGLVVSKTDGDKIIDVFKLRGYEPYEQIPDLWIIESLHDGEVGVSIDYRTDIIHEHGTGIMNWFDANA